MDLTAFPKLDFHMADSASLGWLTTLATLQVCSATLPTMRLMACVGASHDPLFFDIRSHTASKPYVPPPSPLPDELSEGAGGTFASNAFSVGVASGVPLGIANCRGSPHFSVTNVGGPPLGLTFGLRVVQDFDFWTIEYPAGGCWSPVNTSAVVGTL